MESSTNGAPASAALNPHWDKISCDENGREKGRRKGQRRQGRKRGRKGEEKGRDEGRGGKQGAGEPAEQQAPLEAALGPKLRPEELSVRPVGETDMDPNRRNSRQPRAMALSCFVSEG